MVAAWCTRFSTTCSWWLPGAHNSVPHVQYIIINYCADGCLVIIAQWQEHWWLKSVALCLIPSNYLAFINILLYFTGALKIFKKKALR